MHHTVPYLLVLGRHRVLKDRLVLRHVNERFYLWFGDRPSQRLEEVPAELAGWLLDLPVMERLPEPCGWVAMDDLPTRGQPEQTERDASA